MSALTTTAKPLVRCDPARHESSAESADLVVHVEREALESLRCSRRAAEWDALLAECPWAGAFQSSAFCHTWYETYRIVQEPVLVEARNPDGRLVGLLPLARHRATGAIAVCGTHHAEYQTWLATPEHGDDFASAAFTAIAEAFPEQRLVVRYVAPGSPLEWTRSAPWTETITRESMGRALIDVADPDAGASSLKKKSNRSRLNRLKRAGDVTFERVTDAAAFARLLDALIPIYDFRQGAVHDVLPFAGDPRKRHFHETLFEIPGLIHATALRVGGQLAAGHVGVRDRDAVCLGVYGYAPEHAAHSPGKLLLLHLAGHLEEEDIPVLDMTPGPGWKDRFATRTDAVEILTFEPSARRRLVRAARLQAEALAKRIALAVGTTPDVVRGVIGRARSLAPRQALRAAARPLRFVRDRREVLVFGYTTATARRLAPDRPLRRGSVADLCRVPPAARSADTSRYLEHARSLHENGAQPFVRLEGGQLAQSAWLALGDGKRPVRIDDVDVAIPAGDVLVVVDEPLVSASSADAAGATRSALLQMLRDGADQATGRTVWTVADASDSARIALLRELGFELRDALHVERAGGKSRQWSATPRRPQAPLPAAERLYHATKRCGLHVARGLGLFRLARVLTRDELRILCYHGFAIDDESSLGPRLFMEADTFARRMDTLEREGYPVLELSDALERLENGTLPDGATAITIDDGPYSILSKGIEHLERHGFPATLYQTTYYVVNPSPVFRMAVQYLAWRSPLPSADLSGLAPGADGEWRAADPEHSDALLWRIIEHAETHLDEPSRVELAREIGVRLNVDLADLEESRLVSLLREDELRDLVARGIDLQIHTHRHRFPCDEAIVRAEIEDNRAVLEPLRDGPLEHICYPSNEYSHEQFAWLRDLGVRSGTTCNVGLNPRGTEPLALKRFLDGECIADIEFLAEQSGFLELLRRAVRR